jgi:hypothetical protein
MKKAIYIFALAIFLSTTGAFGGERLNAPVGIDTNFNVAWGSMIDAAYSSNDLELIGCGVNKFGPNHPWAGDDFLFCQARDANDDYIACRTRNLDLAEALSAINAYSYIEFGWDPSGDQSIIGQFQIYPAVDGECNYVRVSSQSLYIPRSAEKGKTK